jgi:hypothetical protein
MGRIATNTVRFTARHALVIALAVTLHPTTSFALGTDEQRAACTPDVFRLCFSEIPNVDRIVGCLTREKRNLSPGCQVVFNGPEKQAVATKSLATPESEWCLFSNRVQEAGQEIWLKWCGTSAHSQ